MEDCVSECDDSLWMLQATVIYVFIVYKKTCATDADATLYLVI